MKISFLSAIIVYRTIKDLEQIPEFYDKPVPKSRLRKESGISSDYIEQLLSPMARDKMVISTRGRNGGFNTTDRTITAFSIYTLFQGECVDYKGGDDFIDGIVAVIDDAIEDRLSRIEL